VEFFEVIARGGDEPQFVADKIIEDRARVAADGAMGLVGDDEIEIGGRKQPLVFVVEEERLDRADHDLGAPPVVAILLVDDGLEIVRQDFLEGLEGLVHRFLDEPLRIRRTFLIAGDRNGRGKRRDDVGIPALEIPEIMKVAVRQEDEAAILGLGVFTRLLLADERAFVLGFRFEHDEGKALFVQQKKVDEALLGLFKICAEGIE